MLIQDQHFYQGLTCNAYGHCRLPLPWLRVPGIKPKILDLSTESGDYDPSATAFHSNGWGDEQWL